MFYPKYRKTFTLEPIFIRPVLRQTAVDGGGSTSRIFLYIGITALMNKDVRNLIKKML